MSSSTPSTSPSGCGVRASMPISSPWATICSGVCGVTVTYSEYGTSRSRVCDSAICASRSASPIACLGVDSSAIASRLTGFTSAARLTLTWMRWARSSTVSASHAGFSSSGTGLPSQSGACRASTSLSGMRSPKFTTTCPKFCRSTFGTPHSSCQIDSFSLGLPESSSR